MLLAFAFCQGAVIADTDEVDQLKAAYLLNFARFTYWPESAFSESRKNLRICVYKSQPLVDALMPVTSRRANKRKIEVKPVNVIEEIASCHMLYIPLKWKIEFEAIRKVANKYSCLTVSEIKGFVDENGMIEFVKIDKKYAFKINMAESKKAGIRFQSRLIEVAEDVR